VLKTQICVTRPQCVKFCVTDDDLQFEKQLPPFSIGTGSAQYGPLSEPLYAVRITVRTIVRNTLLSLNHNMYQIILSESEYGPLSEPHYYLRITICTTVRTTLIFPNYNMDYCLNHIMLSESQYGPLS